MFGFGKRKKKENGYTPMFADGIEGVDGVVPVEEEEPAVDEMPAEDEMMTLEDGRVFPAAFVREVRSYAAEDLKMILEEQGDLYNPDEYAYIKEVFHERLGDL